MRVVCLFFCLAVVYPSFLLADFVDVRAGDVDGLRDAILAANAGQGPKLIIIIPGPNGETEFEFDDTSPGYQSALPDVTSEIIIQRDWDFPGKVSFTTSLGKSGEFRLFKVTGGGNLDLSGMEVKSFGSPGADGGAILVEGDAKLSASSMRFEGNSAGRNGGAVAATGRADVTFSHVQIRDNSARNVGGGISLQDRATGLLAFSILSENRASVFGCDVNVNSSGIYRDSGNTFAISSSALTSSCGNVIIENPLGVILVKCSSLGSMDDAIDSTDKVRFLTTLLGSPQAQRIESSDSGGARPQAICNDFGSNAFTSLGYNISADHSCGLNQPTDLPGTDPLVERNADGVPIPSEDSPAIDGGAVEALVIGDEDFASLPCGYVDLLGTARPQDGDGDGVFECDIGAVERAGAGAVSDGHSGAFFNASRDGEGTYVEILNDQTAVVYTFTYRPDGSGPAWFIGVGRIEGNAIVIDDLLRPVGTSFGEAFDPDDVVFSPIGGMSMVFPDCAAASPGGNVAYSGEPGLGYEGLITRAARLSNITGCGSETPNPRAGLSGSYYDPARDGEGIIVEWLTSGEVLVVFFTFDQDGNQLWLLGIGTPDGNSVTMDALYASTYTRWGSGFVPAEVTISNWGSFSLTWTRCNGVSFEYSSTVPGFGSATRDYQRLSKLHNTECPSF
jgi:predicted outer membrane repeat protein